MTSPIDDIERLERLKTSGGITGVEFERLKAKLLSGASEPPRFEWPVISPIKLAIVIALIVAVTAIALFARSDPRPVVPQPVPTASPTPAATVAAAPAPDPDAGIPQGISEAVEAQPTTEPTERVLATPPPFTPPVITPKIKAMLDEYIVALEECQGTAESCRHRVRIMDALTAAGMCQGEGEEGARRFLWKPKTHEGDCASE
jgi:hypothetical protein